MGPEATALVAAVVSAVVGGLSGQLAAKLQFRRERKARRGDDAASSVRAALGRAGQLRTVYRRAVVGSRKQQPSDAEMAAAEHDFIGACDQAALEDVAEAARAYVRTGRSYASGDPSVGASAEEDAYEVLARRLRSAVREAQQA